MADYKADITLNEKDSLIDMLNLEKTMAKVYTTAMTEGVSKGFRTVVREHIDGVIDDQFSVFSCLTEQGYMKVQSAPEETLKQSREKFLKVKQKKIQKKLLVYLVILQKKGMFLLYMVHWVLVKVAFLDILFNI